MTFTPISDGKLSDVNVFDLLLSSPLDKSGFIQYDLTVGHIGVSTAADFPQSLPRSKYSIARPAKYSIA